MARWVSRACAVALMLAWAAPAQAADPPVFEGPVDRATCGPGSDPEPAAALQGEVTQKDRDSGRSTRPYTCNLALVGNEPGPGASWQHTWFEDCAYYDTRYASGLGVQVVDVKDPAKPKTVTTLTSQAMEDPWESLSVAENRPDGRKLLAGVFVASLQGAAYFDIYDVEKDCKKPEQIFSGPVSGLNHEGNWAMDGMTYYATGLAPGTVSAVDVDDPTLPTPITHWYASPIVHGLSTSDDGNRLYLADIAGQGEGNGLSIWDTSGIVERIPGTQPRLVGHVGWSDGSLAQHTIPVTFGGKPFVLFVDEGTMGAARFIDITDETKPKVVSKMKLEIHMEANAERAASTENSQFGYDAHYCNVDRRVDPTIVVCSMFESGMRVFDVRDPYHPKEIAYYNPGGTGEAPKNGSNNQSADPSDAGYPSARPRIIPERGEIWFTDQEKGFHVVRFTNGVWPFKPAPATQSAVGLPAPKKCLSKPLVTFRVPRDKAAKSAVVSLNGKVVKRVRGKALRRKVGVRLPAGRHSVVRVVVKTRQGKTVTQTRGYTTCA